MRYPKTVLILFLLLFLVAVIPIATAHEKEAGPGEELLQTPAQKAVTPGVQAAPQAPSSEQEKPSPQELKRMKGSFTFNTSKQRGYSAAVSLTAIFLALLILLVVLL